MANVRFSQAAMRNLDITRTFQRVARIIIDGMQRHIKGKTNLNGTRVKGNAKSTIARKGFDHRMIHTGAFVRNAYVSRAFPRYLIIAIRDQMHPTGKATYYEIAEYNQAGNPNAIPAASDHFGLDDKTYHQAVGMIADSVYQQIEKNLIYKSVIEEVV